MINKIAYLLVIISLFMSAANVNAAEDNTDMQILIANQKKGIVNSWSGAQPVAANQSSPTEYLQRTIEFADGSWWVEKETRPLFRMVPHLYANSFTVTVIGIFCGTPA